MTESSQPDRHHPYGLFIPISLALNQLVAPSPPLSFFPTSSRSFLISPFAAQHIIHRSPPTAARGFLLFPTHLLYLFLFHLPAGGNYCAASASHRYLLVRNDEKKREEKGAVQRRNKARWWT